MVRCAGPRVVLATVLASFMALCGAAAGAATPGAGAVTERVREILRKEGGVSEWGADSKWGADPPAEETAAPSDAPASAPPPGIHAEFSHLFATLPLDADFWWWVRERMVLMAATLGLPADLARLERYLTPRGTGPSDLRTRAYALEALARRTGRDTRCAGGRRLAAAAAAAWRAKTPPNPRR